MNESQSNPHDDDALDDLLREHLKRQLDPQRGRGSTVLAIHARRPPFHARRVRRPLLYLLAACLAISAILGFALRSRDESTRRSLGDGKSKARHVNTRQRTPGQPLAANANAVAGPSRRILPHKDQATTSQQATKVGSARDERARDELALAQGLVKVEEVLRFRTVDEGTLLIDDRLAVRKIRRQWLERTAWVDARHNVRMEQIVPREEVVLVGLPSY